MATTLVLGPPPAPSSSSRVLSSVSKSQLVGPTAPGAALPFGCAALLRLGGKYKVVEGAKGADSGFPEERVVIPAGITPQNLHKYNLYDILGFGGELGAAADVEVIKRAYHRAVLMYHPDKAQYKTADGKEDRTVFLKIQEAFSVLCNEQKRRAYDSQLPFDESIPTEELVQKKLAKGPHKFFKLFDPVFSRNARFAVVKPVPELGDMDTPIDQVYKFYEYWVNFESWRDFTGVGAEHKPDDAGSREEKRWMQKENDRIAKKLKKKEMERLIALVSLAEKYDPRIVADKESRKRTKEAEKNAKENAAKAQADLEANAKAWAEAAEAVESEKRGTATKADKDRMKKNMSRHRNVLRKLLRHSAAMGQGSGEYGIISADEVEVLCSNCQMEDLVEMNEAMGGEPASKDAALVQAAGFDVVLAKLQQCRVKAEEAVEDERIAKDAKKKEQEYKIAAERAARGQRRGAAAAEPAQRELAGDEKAAFEKCVGRYGPGLPNRWESMANYMNVIHSPEKPYTANECMILAYQLTL